MEKVIQAVIFTVGASSMFLLFAFKKRTFITDVVAPAPIVFSYNTNFKPVNLPYKFKKLWSDGNNETVYIDTVFYRSLGGPHHYKIMPTRSLKRSDFSLKQNHYLLKEAFCENKESRSVETVTVFKKNRKVTVVACN